MLLVSPDTHGCCPYSTLITIHDSIYNMITGITLVQQLVRFSAKAHLIGAEIHSPIFS
jgi:hypothetical protein